MLFALRILLLSVHFALASILGLLVSLTRPFNPANTPLCARLYALPAMRILGMRVRLEPSVLADHPSPAVYVANHLSNYDLFVFGQVVPPRTVSLGKQSLKWLPLFGQLYWLAGNVLIHRGNPVRARQAMNQLNETLHKRHISVWIFPEGTRSHGKGLGPFKKGAFQLAISAGVPIIPICSNTYVRGMNLNRWHAGDVIMRALPPISTHGMTLDDMPALMARCHADMAACIAELDREASQHITQPAALTTQ